MCLRLCWVESLSKLVRDHKKQHGYKRKNAEFLEWALQLILRGCLCEKMREIREVIHLNLLKISRMQKHKWKSFHLKWIAIHMSAHLQNLKWPGWKKKPWRITSLSIAQNTARAALWEKRKVSGEAGKQDSAALSKLVTEHNEISSNQCWKEETLSTSAEVSAGPAEARL